MTDELTPQERESLKGLPKERMPSAGLEGRVVGALRDRGVLKKKPQRSIAITNSRVAGLLAASIAVVIGAYSIGLYRGGGRELVTSPVAPAPRQRDLGRLEAPVSEAPEAQADVSGKSKDAELRAAAEKEARDADTPKRESAVERDAFEPEPSADEAPDAKPLRQKTQEKEGLASSIRDESEPPATALEEAPIEEVNAPPPAAEEKSTSRLQSTFSDASRGAAQPLSKSARGTPEVVAPETPALVFARTLSFLLNGTPVVVDAPDSVRIVQDDRKHVIIIYTSDGPIRFRIADDD